MHSFAVSEVTVETKPPVQSDPLNICQDAKLAKLVEMGFQVEEGREALQQCGGDVEAACELLGNTPPAASGLLTSLVRCVSSLCTCLYTVE